MSLEPLKIGLLGLGKMGRNHLRILSMLKSVDLRFIYDIDDSLMHSLAKTHSVKPCDDLASSLRDVDAVIISTPTSTHLDYILETGKYVNHIFVEKPMSDSAEKSQQIISFAEDNGITIQVGFIERYNPAVVALANILDQSGSTINIDFTRTNKLSDRIKDVDVIYDLMIHDIDLALHLNGPVKNVEAYGTVSHGLIGFATASIHHVNGSQSRLLASRVTEKKVRLIQATCEDYFIDCDLLRREIIINKQSQVKQDVNQPYRISSIEEAVEVMPQEALLNEIQSFQQLCCGQNVDVPGALDALNASHVCAQIKDLILHKSMKYER